MECSRTKPRIKKVMAGGIGRLLGMFRIARAILSDIPRKEQLS